MSDDMRNGKDSVIIIDALKKKQEFIVGDGERKTFVIFLADGTDQCGEVQVTIQGREAHVEILGIIVGYGNQKIILSSLQEHGKQGSVSDLLIKSVLFGRAKLYYSGLIKIDKDAQKSNAYQKNQHLLMSPDAWVDSRPYLEILANDVRCTHGATIGKVDNEQLYYVSSRGLSQIQATGLIITGFFQDVLQRILNKDVRNTLESKLIHKLTGLLQKGGVS